MSIVQAVIL